MTDWINYADSIDKEVRSSRKEWIAFWLIVVALIAGAVTVVASIPRDLECQPGQIIVHDLEGEARCV